MSLTENSQCRTAVVENGINKNGFGKYAAQHYYQIDGQYDPSADERQGVYHRNPLFAKCRD
jgi:hypothetical protein